MTSLTLVKRSPVYVPDSLSYTMELEITASQSIPKEVFVKQRLRTPDQKDFQDFFAAIATPVQLEDLQVFTPDSTTSYFRDSKIQLTARTIEYLNSVVSEIQSELSRLAQDMSLLLVLDDEETVVITSTA